ncbi:MAG: HAD family hydrolase [Porphyromonadaceae bacterium]|nr:HAD family hydrolase [Porphyromonadaceae bacterium]
MKEIKGMLFDFGGTLDTNGIHWGIVLQEAYHNAGIVLEDSAFQEIYTQTERKLGSQPIIAPTDTFLEVMQKKTTLQLDYAITHHLLPDTPDIRRRMTVVAEYGYALARRCTARTCPLLQKLKGKYRLAVVSNFYGNLPTVLADFGLDRYFDTIVESQQVGVRKPHPEIFRIALESLGLSSDETLVIGDSYKNDIAPALSLGCIPIWLKGRGWDERENVHTAPYVITDLLDLPSLLERSL